MLRQDKKLNTVNYFSKSNIIRIFALSKDENNIIQQFKKAYNYDRQENYTWSGN